MRPLFVFAGLFVYVAFTLVGFAAIGAFARLVWEFFKMGWSLL